MSPTEPDAPLRSVATTLRLLVALQELDGAGVTTLSGELGVAKSTVHNHLQTLAAYGYVVRDGDTFRLGLKFLDHGGYARKRDPHYRLVHPKVREVADQTGELCQFVVVEHGMGVFVFREAGEQAVNTRTRVGAREHLHHITAGKAILSRLDGERVDAVIDRHGLPRKTEHTITDRERLHDELREIRERGYAFDKEEHVKGLHAIGVAVEREDGEPLGALSVAGPRHRIRAAETDIAEFLRGVADELELNMTFSR